MLVFSPSSKIICRGDLTTPARGEAKKGWLSRMWVGRPDPQRQRHARRADPAILRLPGAFSAAIYRRLLLLALPPDNGPEWHARLDGAAVADLAPSRLLPSSRDRAPAIAGTRSSFPGNILDSHVKGAHELIAEIEQALDGLLQVAERILWVVEEA